MKHIYTALFLIVNFVYNAFGQTEFITTWQTTSPNETITIPTTGSGYNYTVDWGDGTIENGFTGNANHEYAVANVYTVEITGDFPRIYFNNSGDRSKLLTIEQWGTQQWTNMNAAFEGCNNLVLNADDIPDLSAVSSMERMFKGTVNFEDLKDVIGSWNTVSIVNMNSLFRFSGFNENINSWNVSNVENMRLIFANTSQFNQPLNNWDVRDVRSINLAFLDARRFNQDISSWKFQNLENFISIENMFFNATNFNQDLGALDLSYFPANTELNSFFEGTSMSQENYEATLIGWSTIDTAAGETSIPLGVLLNASGLSYCQAALERQNLIANQNWSIVNDTLSCEETDKFITTWQTTTDNESITIRTSGPGFDYIAEWGDGTTTNEIGNATHTYATAGTYTVKISGAFPRLYINNFGSIGNKMRSVEQWGTGKWSSFDRAFEGARNVVINATDVPDLSNVTNMFEAFKDCENLVDNGGQMQNWDVSTIENFVSMFQGASSFDENLGNWDLSGVVSLANMLDGSGLSTANYDATLIGWSENPTTPTSLGFGAVGLQYCIGEAARNTLTTTPYNWSIGDAGSDCSGAFIFTWQATDDQKELSIPTSGSGYDYTVDWGDGVVESNQTGISFHTYASNGVYTVKIQGAFPSVAFGNNPDFRVPAQLVSVEQWGSNAWTDMTRAFSACTNLVINATDIPDLSNTTSLEKMFDGTTNFVDNGGQLGNWNVSTIENMTDMFRNSGMNVNIGLWNVGNVIDFAGMFTGNTAFNQNISGWNIGEFVTGAINMRAMFDSASSFNNPLNTWDMSKVTNMSSMFGFATAFNQPLDNWNTSSVQNMGGMFFGASDFDQNVGDWNLSSVTAMGAMFQLAGLSTTNYDATLIGWATQDTGETIPSNISISFEGSQYCIGEAAKNTLTSVPYNWSIIDDGAACTSTDFFITTWQTTVANESITIPTAGSGYNYAVDWGDGTIETGFTGSATHEYSTSGNYTVKIIGDFPRIFFNNQGDRKKIMSIDQWGDQEWQNMAQAFNGCENLKLEATDIPNLSQVINATRMFANTTNFEDLGGVIGQWNTGNINNMNAMFISSGFNEEIGNWDVSKVTNFSGMFYDCPNFNQNLANWDLSEAVNMRSFISTTSLAASSFTMENYDKTLKGWATLTTGETRIPRDLFVGVNLTRYCDAFVERNLLVSDYGWQISDLGLGCPENDKFITTWEVVAGETITIPTFTGESYRYVVEWGDNTTSAAVDDTPLSHTYEFGRTYRVKITGEFPRIYFNNTGSRNKIISIDQWGTQQWSSMENAFWGCNNLEYTATDAPDVSLATSMSFMFADCSKFNATDLTNWNVSTITKMDYIFNRASEFNGNITNWDVSKVEDFSFAFERAFRFNQDISNWNINTNSDVTFRAMFNLATDFNQPIGKWNTSRVIDISHMLASKGDTFDQSLADWDISNITEMDAFLQASSISQANYDATLIGWTTLEAGESIPTISRFFHAGNSTYCLGESARNILTSAPYNWRIADGGQGCVTPIITLLGDNPQVIEKGNTYPELGAEVTYGATLTINSASVNTNQVGSYMVTYDAINTVSGETATQVTRTVDVVDTTAPVIILNGANPQTIELGAGYTELGATTDDGSVVSIDTSEFMDAVGSYTIYYDATDAAGNAAIQVTRTVDIVDTTAPVITLNGPNPQIIELGDPYIELGATTDDGSPVTLDTNIDLLVSDVGTYTAMYFAVDVYGNSSTVFRTVEVVDTTAPVITLNGPNPQIIELGNPYIELGATTDDGSPVTLDTNISLLVSNVGTYFAMYFAADAYGNSSTVFRTVEVVDTTNPTVVCQNITVQLDDTGNATITAAMIDNGSADLSGIASIAIDITDFDCTNIGGNMVTLTVTDANANTDICMATVTVEDQVAPEFDITTVPTDMEVPFDTGNMYTLADFTNGVVVTDNCDANKSKLATTITQSPVAGTLLAAGDHVVTLTATDDNLNIETVTFTITVSGILSVEENEEHLFTIYPNPTKDQVWIKGLKGEAEVTLSDINGRVLHTIRVMNDQAVSTKDLSEGVYLISIEQDGTLQTIRLIKN